VNDPIPAVHNADRAAGPVEDPPNTGTRAAGRGQGRIALYTTEEAAAILRVKKSWLERQAAKRKIPFTLLGGGYRFTSAHLAEIVLMHEEPPAPRTNAPARGKARRGQGPRHAPGQGLAPLRPRPRGGPRRVA
jgi:excisionase family DNA binding protein